MVEYESKYTDSYFQTNGSSYDDAISTQFELIIWDIEKYYLKKILNTVPEKEIRYMDFACGTGRVISYLGQYIEDRTGIDTSECMLQLAQEKISARYVNGNIVEDETLLGGETFNLITAFRLFLNIENKNRYLILKALRNYLTDDGYLIVNNHMNRYSILGMMAFSLKSLRILPLRADAKTRQRGIINTMSELEFRKVLTASGYEVTRVYRFVLFPGHNSLVILPHRTLVRMEIRLSRIPLLNLMCKDQIYVCRKAGACE